MIIFGNVRYFLILVTSLMLTACSLFKTIPANPYHPVNDLKLTLKNHPNSTFQQLESSFSVSQPLQLTYLVIADIALTPQWFDGLTSIELLKQISNKQFLLRSIIASPWPFKPRELITCVSTAFSKNVIDIKINSCSEKHPITSEYVRVVRANAHWTITQTATNEVKVNYQAWLDPQGNVPAFLFNSKLLSSSAKSLQKLQHLIHQAQKEDYAY
jgi:hypothetical protein